MATGNDGLNQVVMLARRLERLLAKRRRDQRKLDLLDAEVRQARKLLSDLTRPFDVSSPPVSSSDRERDLDELERPAAESSASDASERP